MATEILLEVPLPAAFLLFESVVDPGTTQLIPGGAALTVRELAVERRTHDFGVSLLPIVLSWGREIAVGVVASYLVARLSKAGAKRIRVERIEIELEKDSLVRIILETIEREE